MKHTLKKCAVLLACSSYVVLVAAIPAKADVQNEIPYLWSEFASDDITSVEDVVTPRARGDIFNRGYVRLTNTDGKAGIYGETLCNTEIEEVGLELYLEKYNGSMFTSYDSWDYIEYNTYHNTKTFIKTVDKGYYYRLRGYHYALDAELFEDGITTTDGLPIK